MSFVKDFWLSSFTTFLITILAFGNNVIVTRYLGPDGRGKYSIISYAIMFLALVFGEGVRRMNTVLVGNDRSTFFNLIKFNLIYILIVIIFLFFVDILGYSFLSDFLKLERILFSLTIAISVLYILWLLFLALFLGFSDILRYNIAQISTIGIFLLLNIVGIFFFQFEITGIISNQFASYLFTVIICLWLIGYYKKHFIKSVKNKVIYDLPIILKSTGAALMIFVLLKTDIFIINFNLGSTSAGIYSIGIIISDLFQKVPNVMGPLILSRTVNDPSQSNSFKIAKLVRVTILLNIFLISCLILWGDDIIILLFKNQFLSAYKLILLLIPALFAIGPGSIVYSYFMAKGFPSIVIIINLIVAAINVLFNIIFIPRYGISAAAIICSCTYFLWSVSLLIYFKKNTKIPLGELLIFKKQDFSYLINSVRNKR